MLHGRPSGCERVGARVGVPDCAARRAYLVLCARCGGRVGPRLLRLSDDHVVPRPLRSSDGRGAPRLLHLSDGHVVPPLNVPVLDRATMATIHPSHGYVGLPLNVPVLDRVTMATIHPSRGYVGLPPLHSSGDCAVRLSDRPSRALGMSLPGGLRHDHGILPRRVLPHDRALHPPSHQRGAPVTLPQGGHTYVHGWARPLLDCYRVRAVPLWTSRRSCDRVCLQPVGRFCRAVRHSCLDVAQVLYLLRHGGPYCPSSPSDSLL